MTILQSIFITLTIAIVGLIGYTCGELYGSARIMNEATAIEYLEANDRGCDDINVSLNSNTGEMEGVCEIFLRQGVNYDNLNLYIIGEDAI